MSRGSKTFYINSLTDIDTQGTLNTEINGQIGETPQWGDVAVEKDANASLDPAVPANYRRANVTFQFDGANWIKILERSSDDPSADTKTAFNQETIIANNTPVRRAHMEEVRSFLSFIQRVYAKRYGDSWFNDHDWTKAVMKWSAGAGSSTGRIFIGNYGPANDQKYMTYEFGQTDNALMKFIHRAAGGTYLDVLELRKALVYSYVDVEIQEELTVQKDARFNEDVYVNQKASADYLVNRNQFFYLNPSNNLDEDTGAPTDGRALARGTGNVLRVNYAGDFAGGTLVQGALNHSPDVATSPASTYRVWTEEYEGHQTDNPDGLGIDACMLHGYHAGNLTGQIPVSNGTTNANFNADMIDGYHWQDIVNLLETGSFDNARPGYYILPGGFCFQWGNSGPAQSGGWWNFTAVFPLAFTNVFGVTMGDFTAGYYNAMVKVLDNTHVEISVDGGGSTVGLSWLAYGYLES